MSTHRALSMAYLLSALAFGVAVMFDHDPSLEQASRRTVATVLGGVQDYVIQPGVGLVRDGSARLAGLFSSPDKSAPQNKASAAPTPRRPAPPAQVAPPAAPAVVTPPAPQTQSAAVDAPKFVRITPAQHVPQSLTLVPQAPAVAPPPPVVSASVSPAEITRVTQRLKDNLTPEMVQNFSLFLYVSKADSGPWAQHMFVFRKEASGALTLLYNWPASTGREKDEIAPNGTRQPSFTPRGYYQLDPGRMFKTHYSGQWHEPMPHAMFFSWEKDGYQTGLAIHGAVGIEVAQLGTRASAGCIRIAPENAALLFNIIRTQYKGLAPRFAYDRRTATMSNDGVLMRDPSGNLKMADGYKVLVFVENYGGENIVAALF